MVVVGDLRQRNTTEYYTVTRKDEILKFAATWMELKAKEISKRRTNAA